MSSLQELKEFWDEFAEEYTEIQAESQLSLLADVKQYIKKDSLFPTTSFLDLAGGSGKYIDVFISLVEQYTLVDLSTEMLRIAREKYTNQNLFFIEKDQASFLAATADGAYEIVFSAMNPALTSEFELQELLRIARKGVYLLRQTVDEDDLFSPLEEKIPDMKLIESYKQWLKVPYQVTTFVYHSEEKIEKSFFFEYFVGEVSQEKLEELAQRFFKEKTIFNNSRKIVFELLSIKK